jgi:hypothetical protein
MRFLPDWINGGNIESERQDARDDQVGRALVRYTLESV